VYLAARVESEYRIPISIHIRVMNPLESAIHRPPLADVIAQKMNCIQVGMLIVAGAVTVNGLIGDPLRSVTLTK
jgi:hypothetical protein